MPRYHWTPEMVTTAIACIADGGTYGEAAAAVDLTHHAVAGMIYRLRESRDPRLPDHLRVKTPGRQPRKRRDRVTSTDGAPHEGFPTSRRLTSETRTDRAVWPSSTAPKACSAPS
ncbi:hypothetical protein MOP88_14050 [Sphingomonas sp. WKB10]|nr:hypothetical protein [Sphingomonas sp. WKB10]